MKYENLIKHLLAALGLCCVYNMAGIEGVVFGILSMVFAYIFTLLFTPVWEWIRNKFK